MGSNPAGVCAGLGDREQAFQWLESDFAQRSRYVSYVTWNLDFDDLRTDPRYRDLVRRMGLQP